MSTNANIQPELLHHYPWLPSLKNFYSDVATKDPSQFVSEIFLNNKKEIEERVLEFFKASLNNKESIRPYEVSETNLHIYLFLKILLYVLDIDIITNRIANLYSKVTYNSLIIEHDYNLYNICHDLGIDLQYFEEPIVYRINSIKNKKEKLETSYRIHYIDYIKLSSNLQDKYRKLVNNPISEGYVFVRKNDIARLLQEYVRDKILEINEQDEKNKKRLKEKLLKIEEFKELYEKIVAIWEKKKEEYDYSIQIGFEKGKDISHLFPPCIKNILSQAKQGKNLSHTERLFLTFFLLALDYPTEKVVDVFSTMPDFDKEKTHYQVNFAKKKDYTPHSCRKLKSLNLCKASKYSDELCLDGYYSKTKDEERELSHPLFYVQYQQYKKSKKKYGK